MNQSLLHSFEYPLQNESDCEPLDQPRAFSTHPPFESEGSTFRPDLYSTLNHSRLHPLSLPSANGLDYRPQSTISGCHDASFQPGPGISMSPLTSSRGSSSTSPSSGASSFAFIPQHSYHTSVNASYHPGGYSTAASSLYSPSVNYSQFVQGPLEVRPRIAAIARPSATGMLPPSRSSTNTSPVSPPGAATARDHYSTSIPHTARHAFPHHGNIQHISTSPHSPFSAMSRSLDSSVSRESPSSGHPFHLATSPMQLDTSASYALGSQPVPPFEETKPFYSLSDAAGTQIQPDIQAKIDKGFFKTEDNWTCYRRNYFSVACCYSLKPDVDPLSEPIYLNRNNATREPIQSFSICITARVDGEDGKQIDLVQHTPKRDKGPMCQPEMLELLPHPSGSMGMFPGTASGFGSTHQLSPDYEQAQFSSSGQTSNIATFERIQFKKATANNGKRRAAQQYFHIVVELFAKVPRGKSSELQSIMIAHRVSAPMVVRGRSPGHYQDERRGSQTSMGPGGGGGGSNGEGGSGSRDPGSAGPSGESHSSMSGLSYSSSAGRLGSGAAYQVHQLSLAQSSSGSHSVHSSSTSSSLGSGRPAFVDRSSDPVLTMEEAAHIEEYPGYQYYPSTLFENQVNSSHGRPNLPPVRSASFKNDSLPSSRGTAFRYDATSPRTQNPQYRSGDPVKSEPARSPFHGLTANASSSAGSNWYPGSSGGGVVSPKDCRRFQGMETSRGFYPAMPAL